MKSSQIHGITYHGLYKTSKMLNPRVIRHKKFLVASIITLVLFLLFIWLKKHGSISQVSREINHQVDQHRLAILVPFRDRFDELIVFVPYIHKFLNAQKIENFTIYILNQSRRYRFNRGALTNVGFILAKNNSDYIAIHDVDLLPINKNLSYSYPRDGPYHLAAPEYHPNYNYDKYFGGILLINNVHFELLNGMSNKYFGWGLEDDEFYTRCRAANLPIYRPKNLTTTKTDSFLHLHYDRKRDTYRTKKHRELLKRRDLETGIRDSKFKLNSKHKFVVDDYECTIFNIDLYCDPKHTPWCLNSYVNYQSSTTHRSRT